MESKMRRAQDTPKVISSRTAPRHPVPRGRVYRERCSGEGRHLAPPPHLSLRGGSQCRLLWARVPHDMYNSVYLILSILPPSVLHLSLSKVLLVRPHVHLLGSHKFALGHEPVPNKETDEQGYPEV